MKKICVFYLLLCSAVIFGQQSHGAGGTYFVGQMQYDGVYLPKNEADLSIEGSTYLFPNWDGKYEVYVSENKGYSISNLNYNVKTNSLESKVSKDSVFQFDIKNINFIKHESIKYKLYKIRTSSELFQEIYVSNTVSFVKGFNVIFKKGSINPMTQVVLQKDEYSVKEKFYLKLNNENFVELKLNKKTVLNLLGDKAFAIEKYTSDLNLSFKSETDMVNILQKYDSL